MSAGKASFNGWVTGYPRAPIVRAVHRAPILLWRLGLGCLAGRAFVLLTTRGRNSGLPRRTVVSLHSMGGLTYSPCPYGELAEWYRNLTVDPRVTIQTHRGAESALAARVTDDDELSDFYGLLDHRDRQALEHLLDQAGIAHDVAAMVENMDRVHVVRFDPAGPSGLPPQRADLAWAWGVLAALILVRRVAIAMRGRPSAPARQGTASGPAQLGQRHPAAGQPLVDGGRPATVR